ncbi:oxygenase MpaB family protein [Streptomyces sp. YH02]|uniref:oxygenase MpaB family protein n=1 Tax=Streptomyces sp. YH02 TaxID=3256999 RepID=UPI0037580028
MASENGGHSTHQHPHAPFQRLAITLFPDDVQLGLNLGLFRTFAIPQIAKILAGTGKMTQFPRARAKATGEIMYTLIRDGLDGPSGSDAIRALNRLHARLPAEQQHFIYVLAAFCVTPMLWMQKNSARIPSNSEMNSAYSFYADLACRMNLAKIPENYAALALWMKEYESHNFTISPEGKALYAATRGLISARFPSPLKRLGPSFTDALLDPPLRKALGADDPGIVARLAVRAVLGLRRQRTLRRR